MVSPGPEGMGSGWRLLIATWVVLGAVMLGGVGLLAWMGPPTVAEAGPTARTVVPPPAAMAAAVPRATERTTASPPAPPTTGPAVTPAALPAAPEPPPLPLSDEPSPVRPGQPIAAPDPALLEPGPYGPLPRVAPGGRSSIRAYGRPFDREDPRPRVGLIIGGLGLNAALTEEAIHRLPGAVTLAFSPYAPHAARLLDQARAKGMELLVALPLEPTGYPLNNPGDHALLTGLTPAENRDRLDWVLSRFAGYVGAIGAHGPMRGERFALLGDRLAALQEALHRRGLLYVDPRPGAEGPGRAWGRAVDILVDEPATRGEIEIKLGLLERLAREHGAALGYAGEASPVLVERVAVWAGTVESRGLVLAPVSALIGAPVAASEVTPARLRAN